MKNFLLGWYQWVLRSLQKIFFLPIEPTNLPIKLIIWRDAHLGDGLLSLPALVRIRENFPHAHLILVSHNDGIPGIHFKDYLKEGVVNEIWDRSFWSWKTFVNQMRKSKATHLIALMPYSASLKWLVASMFLVRISKIKRAGGWKKETTFLFKRKMMNSIFPSELNRLNAVLNDLSLEKLKNINPLPIQKKEKGFALKSNQKTWIFAPFTKGKANFWGESNWINLGIELSRRYSIQILVVGGSNDRQMAKEWIQKWGFGTFENRSIPELLELLNHAELIIGADSGVIHLANLIHRPNIALFGNSDYRGKWAHSDSTFQTILYPEIRCTKCLGKRDLPCHCMDSLSLEAVLSATDSYC